MQESTGRARNHKYAWSVVPGILVITGNLAGGWYTGLNTVFSLVVLAILERFIKEDTSNLNKKEDWFPDGLLFFHVFLQTASIATMLYASTVHDLNPVQYVLMILSTGINSGASAIVIAHEFVHRKNRIYRFMGQYLLFTALNIYFYIDHLKVHHKWVGTPKDPATSKMGEGVYRFFLRSSLGQIRSSFNLEYDRLKSSGHSGWSYRNYITGSSLLLIIVIAAMWYFLGTVPVMAFVSQGIVANFLLEYTNYIEHYGLRREAAERVSVLHSWQTDKVISRFFLIDLSRHTDHHFYASKPYHTLDSFPDSPVLPLGYVSMIYYALIPPLFFKKMDPLVKEIESRKK